MYVCVYWETNFDGDDNGPAKCNYATGCALPNLPVTNESRLVVLFHSEKHQIIRFSCAFSAAQSACISF